MTANASADLVLAPAAVIRNDLGEWAHPSDQSISKAFDQSGLQIPYVSGVTDFGSYLALSPKHQSQYATNPETVFVSAVGQPLGFIDFDLGESYSVNSFVLWQSWNPSEQIRDFSLFTSGTPDFTSSTLVGSFTATRNPNNFNGVLVDHEAFDLIDTVARYVRLEVVSTDGSFGYSNIGELAFGVSAIPEASSFLFLSLPAALCGIASCRRRKNRRA